MSLERKKSVLAWGPVYLVDDTDGKTPETGIAYGDLTVKYAKEGDTSLSTKTMASADWEELGDGWYRIRFSTTELNTAGNFEYDVVASGTRHYPGHLEIVEKTKDDLATDLATIDTVVDAIKAKTDNLPADPADDSDIDTQLAAIKTEVDKVAAADVGTPTTDSLADKLMNKDGGKTFSKATDSLEAIRDRGDAAWVTGGGGSIDEILNTQPLIPFAIDLANTATVRIGLGLTNMVDDLPTTAEITPGTITIDRKPIGGTSWTNVVNAAACSEVAGQVYYDEVFDSGSGYAAGDTIRITFKNQKITVAANDYEITGTDGWVFHTYIREAMRGTDSGATASGLSTHDAKLDLVKTETDKIAGGMLNTQTMIPNAIDLANTVALRIGLGLTNMIDDLPTTGEITPGTITIDRKAIGGTSWTNVVNAAACSEVAGVIYYDEVFDNGSGYAAGDSIRITFKNQKITVGGNDYEITGSDGWIFHTFIREAMRGTDSAATASALNTHDGKLGAFSGSGGDEVKTQLSRILSSALLHDIYTEVIYATSQDDTRKVAIGEIDRVNFKVKDKDASDWSSPIYQGTVYAWYKNLGESIPYKYGPSS